MKGGVNLMLDDLELSCPVDTALNISLGNEWLAEVEAEGGLELYQSLTVKSDDSEKAGTDTEDFEAALIAGLKEDHGSEIIATDNGREAIQSADVPSADTVPLEKSENFDFSPESLDSFELEVQDVTEQEGFKYPALLLRDVLFMDCLRVLKAQKQASQREVDTWICTDDTGSETFQNIGTLKLDSTMLLTLRHLRIAATLYLAEGNVMDLDLDNPEVIERFI